MEFQAGERERVRAAYRTALGRVPTPEEVAAAQVYLAKAGRLAGGSSEALASYLRALLSSNEFLFVE